MACNFEDWENFFKTAGITASASKDYARKFMENRMTFDLLEELTRDHLKEMNIQALGDQIRILRHARLNTYKESIDNRDIDNVKTPHTRCSHSIDLPSEASKIELTQTVLHGSKHADKIVKTVLKQFQLPGVSNDDNVETPNEDLDGLRSATNMLPSPALKVKHAQPAMFRGMYADKIDISLRERLRIPKNKENNAVERNFCANEHDCANKAVTSEAAKSPPSKPSKRKSTEDGHQEYKRVRSTSPHVDKKIV